MTENTQTTETVTDEATVNTTPVFTDAAPQAGTSIADKIDEATVQALTSDTDQTDADDVPTAEPETAADEVPEDVTETPVEKDEPVEAAPVTDDAPNPVEADAQTETEADAKPVEDAQTEPVVPEAEAPVEDIAEPKVKIKVIKDKTSAPKADEGQDVSVVVVEKFTEAIEDEEIDLYPKVAKINKTAFKRLLNSNQGYDQAASEAFRAEEDKQARKLATKTLREVFRDNEIKMKPDEFEAQYPEAHEQVLDAVAENDVSYAEWEAVTNSVGDENFVHYVEGLSLPFGTSSKQDIEEAVTKVQETLGLADVDAANTAKNGKAVTSAIRKALKGNGDVKFAVVWRQNAADVVSYFPFESRTAEIVSPVLLAVAVKAADAPKSVKLDPVTAQAKLVGTYSFKHSVTETKDGSTVSNVAVYGSDDLPNKEAYYEREVEFFNPDEEI